MRKQLISLVAIASLGLAAASAHAQAQPVLQPRTGVVESVKIANPLPVANGTFSMQVRIKGDPTAYTTDGSKELEPILWGVGQRVAFDADDKGGAHNVRTLD